MTAVLEQAPGAGPRKVRHVHPQRRQTCTATTDATGTATCSITPGEAAGSYPLTAMFAGDASFVASTGSATFVVTLEETALAYTGDTSVVDRQSVDARAASSTDDPAAGTRGGEAADPPPRHGQYRRDVRGNRSQPRSPRPIASVSQFRERWRSPAAFAGDTFYLPATATASVQVFPPPATGAFVIGDLSAGSMTAGTNVYFWGSQWAKRNSQSGGGAPERDEGLRQQPDKRDLWGNVDDTGPVAAPTHRPRSPVRSTSSFRAT